MKKQAFLVGATACIILACTVLAGCTAQEEGPVEPPVATPVIAPAATGSVDAVVAANNLFAYDLYHTLSSDDQYADRNIFFSPYSISTALALTYEGAAGTTADEIRSVFHFPENDTVRLDGYAGLIAGLNPPDAAYTLTTANALWAEETYPFLPAYIETAERSYAAEVENMDFISAPEESRQTINRWVEDQTQDRIQDLIPGGAIHPLTRLVITNAVYFKGAWALPFDKNETHPVPFTTENGDSVTVDMMQRTDEDAVYGYTETDTLQVLRMPYEHDGGRSLSMLVLLPKDNEITLAEDILDTEELDATIADMERKRVRVFFPKFTLETTYSLSGTLAVMGMPTAFGYDADFSGMDGTDFLYISDAFHKAFVDVNEEGTEAAAATAIVMTGKGMAAEEPIPLFRVDHPFIFLITDDETGTILFMGRMSDTTA